jgi:MFS family permease
MQNAFLITSKNYSEKQCGIMFFVFGMSQFLFQAPAGYLMDYTNNKISWLATAAVVTTCLTILTAGTAQDGGGNLGFMVLVKFLQGAITALIPPGLNSITQGIVGTVGMTQQVSRNEMMNHLGTSILVLTGSIIAFFQYPNIGILFIVSPIACVGVIYFLSQIKPEDIDHAAARGLVSESSTPDDSSLSTLDNAYIPPTETPEKDRPATPVSPISTGKVPISNKPSFNLGVGSDASVSSNAETTADTPLQVLRDPTLLTFIIVCFLFHLSNGTVLPLVMQSLAIGNGGEGILLSGLCIIVAQVFMVLSAKICGDFSGKYGRKNLFLIGLFSVPIRCLILTLLLGIVGDEEASSFMHILILSTQILDGVGAGVFGTMYILVTSDISKGSGRFSLTLGLTTAAMSIGGTVSGYLGQALAQDIGYRQAFIILGTMALVPAVSYLLFMPETLQMRTIEMDVIQEEEDEQSKEGEGSNTNFKQFV